MKFKVEFLYNSFYRIPINNNVSKSYLAFILYGQIHYYEELSTDSEYYFRIFKDKIETEVY